MEEKEALSQSEFWKKELAEWESSGLKAFEYCRMKGLGRHKFFYWKKKLAKSPVSIEFIEIPRTKSENKRPGLVIGKGPFTVEIPPGFDSSNLERVLRVLESL